MRALCCVKKGELPISQPAIIKRRLVINFLFIFMKFYVFFNNMHNNLQFPINANYNNIFTQGGTSCFLSNAYKKSLFEIVHAGSVDISI